MTAANCALPAQPPTPGAVQCATPTNTSPATGHLSAANRTTSSNPSASATSARTTVRMPAGSSRAGSQPTSPHPNTPTQHGTCCNTSDSSTPPARSGADSTSRELPPHGTYARANGRPAAGIKPCKCQPCTDAYADYRKRRIYLKNTGRSLTVDAAEAARHLRTILDAGAGWNETAKAIGYDSAGMCRLLSGERKTIRRARAERILALRPATPAPEVNVSAEGSMRRVRALLAIGHPVWTIAQASGLDASVLALLIGGRKTLVRQATAEAIAHAYDALKKRPGESARSRNKAAREGWPTPEQWDGEIDNPAADPARWARDKTAERTVEAIVEDAEWLHDVHGLSWEAVAAQLRMPVGTLHQYRTRVRRRAEAGGGL